MIVEVETTENENKKDSNSKEKRRNKNGNEITIRKTFEVSNKNSLRQAFAMVAGENSKLTDQMNKMYFSEAFTNVQKQTKGKRFVCLFVVALFFLSHFIFFFSFTNFEAIFNIHK